jgi:hypothetical protein
MYIHLYVTALPGPAARAEIIRDHQSFRLCRAAQFSVIGDLNQVNGR